MSLSADTSPIIFGCTGPTLDADETAFFKAAKPAGFILFQKNCVDKQQVTALCATLRATVGWAAPILIDQEGGRVQRLKAPTWPGDFPSMRSFGHVFKQNENAALGALENNYATLAAAQVPLGIDVNCVPVLDVVPETNKVRAIDDRSFGSDPDAVGILGLAAVRASIKAGMTPVMKHMPGHGRAVVDSHYELPHVHEDREILERDWQPFKTIAAGVNNDDVWGMSAHVIYPALDPDLPATLSPTIITNVMRIAIGFDGLLLSDDLFMNALEKYGDVPERVRKCIAAGLDIALHCHGTVAEREKAVAAVGKMRPDSLGRLTDWLK